MRSGHLKPRHAILEGVQRRATKFILQNYELSYLERLRKLDLLPISYWLEIKDFFQMQTRPLRPSLLTDVVVLTPSDEILPSAYPSAKLNSATSTNQNLPSKFWKGRQLI